ncbi:hypothetical protein MMC24_004951 [Lignoscripta atroalba]|nr:hypothetical protein [Lignoscripta atroalba]
MCFPSLEGGIDVEERRQRYPGEPRRKRLNFVRDRNPRYSDEWALARSSIPRRLQHQEQDTVEIPREWVQQHQEIEAHQRQQMLEQLRHQQWQQQQQQQQQSHLQHQLYAQQHQQQIPPPPPPPPGPHHHLGYHEQPQGRIENRGHHPDIVPLSGPHHGPDNDHGHYNHGHADAHYAEIAPRVARMPSSMRWGPSKGRPRSSRRESQYSYDDDDDSYRSEKRRGRRGKSVIDYDSDDSFEHLRYKSPPARKLVEFQNGGDVAAGFRSTGDG